MRRVILSFLAVLLAGVGQATGQENGRVEGTVRAVGNRPLENARVVIVGTNFSTGTNAQGHYAFESVPAGRVEMRVAAPGFRSSNVSGLRTIAGQTVIQDFKLESAVAFGVATGAFEDARINIPMPVLLRFQLIKATTTRTTDPAIQEIGAALKDLFRFSGYTLLSQAVVAVDYSPNAGGSTTQLLRAEGTSYQLTVSIEGINPDAVQLSVKLWALSAPRGGAAGQLFGTKVSVSFGHTVVLGSTQPAGVTAGTLILAVKPEVRQYRREPTDSIRTVYPVSAVDDPVQYLNGPLPKYPDSLKVRSVSGRVTLRYIVGIDGKVEAPSIQVLTSTHPGFEQPSVEAIKGSLFRPALLKGVKVRQMVEQVVRFTPGRTSATDSSRLIPGVYSSSDVDDPVQYVGGSMPVYPDSLKAAKVSGSVTLRYIVAADGKVEGPSIQVLNSTNRAFEQPAIDAVKGSIFRPAILKGTKVRQLVEQVVRFSPN